MMWNWSGLKESFEIAKDYGYESAHPPLADYTTFKSLRDSKIRKLNKSMEQNWHRDGIDHVRGWARFTGENTITVERGDGGGQMHYKAPHILLATGGHPRIPNIPGAEYGITSDEFFHLEKIPSRIAIVGAGYIAVELAGMLAQMSVETHLFFRGKFLGGFDPMIQKNIADIYAASGVILHNDYSGFRNTDLLKQRNGGEKLLRLTESDGKAIEVDELLWAVGRSPSTSCLGIDVPGVAQNSTGHITVDQYQNTSAPGIYAVGDVTGKFELTPVAIAAGRALADRLFGPLGQQSTKIEYENIPTVLFSHPEVGTTGLTEPQARERYGDSSVKVYETRFRDMFYSFSPDRHLPTIMKMICVGPDSKIVGLHMLGRNVSEMLQGFSVAVKMGATKQDFDNTIAIHPTAAEELVTMK